jgi:hypothetical protein
MKTLIEIPKSKHSDQKTDKQNPHASVYSCAGPSHWIILE